MFLSKVRKESKEKHIWKGVTLPNRNSPPKAFKWDIID